MREAQTSPLATGDNLNQLLALLNAARAEEAKCTRVDLPTAYRQLLAVIDRAETMEASTYLAA